MSKTTRPTFRDLDASEAAAILARNHVGRIAYSFHDRVDIEPIHYVYADGVIHLRTVAGSKLATLAHSPWPAFEVDEVDGLFDWRSVVVHGSAYRLDNAESPAARASYDTAIRHLRTLVPHALDDDDPTPERTVVLQIHPATVTGREARSTASGHDTAQAPANA